MSVAARIPRRFAADGGMALAIVAGGAMLASLMLGNYYDYHLGLAVVYVLLGLSLVVLTGWSGQLNLHVAALGLGWGAYAGYALIVAGVPPLLALLLAGVVAAPLGALVAGVAVRFRGLELAVATLALGLIFELLFFRNLAKFLGKFSSTSTPFESSFLSMPRPALGPIDFRSDTAYFMLCLAIAATLFALVNALDRGHTGRTLRALREREVAAEVLGVPVERYRIGAFVLSIFIAATAGALFASLKTAIAPDGFNLDLSFQLLAATVIGGIRTPAGAVIGGGLLAVAEIVRTSSVPFLDGEKLLLLFGVGMILVLWRRPAGLAGILRERASGRAPTAAAFVEVEEGVVATGALSTVEVQRRIYASKVDRLSRRSILRVDEVRVRFGGVQALDGVSLAIPEGEICALIGPNGAGKSTLFNTISGVTLPDSGHIFFRGSDVTELPPSRRAVLGIGRTFQTVEVFRDETVMENLLVAGHLLRSSGPVAEALRLSAARRSERDAEQRALEIISMLGLEGVASRKTAELPLGLLRVLEVGMAMVARPKLLLLDEPSAGLDPAETEMLATLVARLRTAHGLAVLLVEHDMSMVGSIAEHVYVLDFGRIIAQGTPAEVRADPLVLEKYLGEAFVEPVEPERPMRAAATRSRRGR